MTTRLIQRDVWTAITGSARRTKRRSWVAVAYFGKDGHKLLPLRPGSHLAVDASEAAVKSGMTCPAALKKLVAKGVRVYSVENLHAKVFVVGSTAFVGSPNASHHSAGTLVEAMVETSDRRTVAEAKAFVGDLCLVELGPKAINRLTKMYRPPHIVGRRQQRRRTATRTDQPLLSRVYLAQLDPEEPPASSKMAEEQGESRARTRMRHPRSHELERIWWHGNVVPLREGDVAVQILKEADGRRMVSPPGTVVHLERWRRGRGGVTFVYLEVRKKRRKALNQLARQIGEGAEKRLSRGGTVNQEFAKSLLAAWGDTGAR
ncbi:MAG TPA: hypothetical protein PLM61_07870 [Thermoanaerobaculales bacterium]|nr:hypothetical protein [Thermoanaerobaculales bacterium]